MEQRQVLNPDYDPEMTYINRSNRKEWVAVGLLGKLYVRDDGICQPGDRCKALSDGTATKSDDDTGYYVLSRKSEHTIRILFK